MFCERCGKQIDEALNFCNACGAQLRRDDSGQKSILNTLVTALIVVTTAGLGVLIGILAILLDKLQKPEPVFIFAVIYLMILFGICFMIMRQVSKLIDAKLTGKYVDSANIPQQPLVQLPPRTTAQLEEYRQPASVTDSTTRTLDKVPVGER